MDIDGKSGVTDSWSRLRKHDMSRFLIGKDPAKAALSCPRQYPYKPKAAMGTIPEESQETSLQEPGTYTSKFVHPNGSRLLDAYEIKAITKQLHQYIESNRSKQHGSHQSRVCPDHDQTKHEQPKQLRHDMKNGMEKHNKGPRGFRFGQAMMCRTATEAVIHPISRPRSLPVAKFSDR